MARRRRKSKRNPDEVAVTYWILFGLVLAGIGMAWGCQNMNEKDKAKTLGG